MVLMSQSKDGRWNIIIPVKELDFAKTRFFPASDRDRSQLALAFAQDVVAAALATRIPEKVIVVTNDSTATAALTKQGAICFTEPEIDIQHTATSSANLNAAIRYGIACSRRLAPDLSVAVIAGDLPALRPQELTAVLRAARASDRAFVPDRNGSGTSLLTVGAGIDPDPRFGTDSATSHRASGAADLIRAARPGVRCDVDVAADLIAALQLGVGEHTAEALVSASPALLPIALWSLDALP